MAIRVLITADAVGGVWQYATDLARQLRSSGFVAKIAVLGPALDAGQRAQADGIELVETGLPLDWLADRPEPILAAGGAIAALATGFDLVHLNMPALAAAARFEVPVVASVHGCPASWWAAVRGGELPAELAWRRDLTARGLRRSDRVTAPTCAYAEMVRQLYALQRSPVTVHNGRRFPAATSGPVVGLAPVVTVGRLWDEAKNMRLLDRVAGRLGAPFAAFGSPIGPHGATFTSEHLRLGGHVAEAELATLLSTQPIFVSAATFEPFGLALLEAAQAGCPLILSDIASFRELWDEAALFVPPHDEAGFVAVIETLLADASARLRLGGAARHRAARYSVSAMASATAALYTDVLAARRRAAA